MRSIWKGALSFGLVHIPCRLYAATEEHDVQFRQLHRACRTPIVYRRVCPRCDQELQAADIVRGVEVSPGRFALIEAADLEPLAAHPDHVIEIMDFVRREDVDPLHFTRGYFVGPVAGGARPYALLRAALARTQRAAVARLALRARPRLALVRVLGGCLVVEAMRDPDEIRDWREVEDLPSDRPVPERELDLAVHFIEHLSAPWDPGRYVDTRRAALEELIASKTPESPAPGAEGEAGPAVFSDLLAALEASVRAAEARTTAAGGNGAAVH